MCGIVGLWDATESDVSTLATTVRTMRDTLVHRGPDDADIVIESESRLVLGHRRLAIVDLSPEGRQPMRSPSQRYTMVFNGEVYNHRELRAELPDVRWRGTSDTETMLAAIDRWGLEGALRRFVGMFGLAVWDHAERALHLVRDRLGIKPVYWGRTSSRSLVFASEARALRAHSDFDMQIDRDALAAYFETSCVPAPLSIHRNARKLEPGTIATFRDPQSEPELRRFWSAPEIYERAARDQLRADDGEIVSRVESALRDAVRLRLIADVPVGAFLSGGIDSSIVVALAQEISPTPVRTFSIGLADRSYDESAIAADVARHLGTRHTALTITGADALAMVPELPSIYDEPFADSSQFPTYLVSRLAREHVTVALSGDGGDEVFGGYNRHVWAARLAAVQAVPNAVRTALAAALEGVPMHAWDAVHARVSPPLPAARLLGDKVHKAARALRTDTVASMHSALRQQWWPSPVLGARHDRRRATTPRLPATRDVMLRDLLEYLPDDVLTKVDRASMAVSLEARVPLLDHRVVELAAQLPPRATIRQGRGKWVLREILSRRLPPAIFERPKSGFSVPMGTWLRGPLRDWAESLLEPAVLDQAGLDAPLIRSRWQAHLDGTRESGLALWDVVAYRAWQEGVRQSIPRSHGPRLAAGAPG